LTKTTGKGKLNQTLTRATRPVNALFKAAAEGSLKGILGFETRALVSSDYTNDPRSAIIDAQSTMVINGTQVKIYAWYDNEWGYACRLADITRMVAASL
jgi:glyceraldehyde 3-phosphate dehydrogenase